MPMLIVAALHKNTPKYKAVLIRSKINLIILNDFVNAFLI